MPWNACRAGDHAHLRAGGRLLHERGFEPAHPLGRGTHGGAVVVEHHLVRIQTGVMPVSSSCRGEIAPVQSTRPGTFCVQHLPSHRLTRTDYSSLQPMPLPP